MTIPKAVLVLRKKTGLDQVTFAALAETTPETVSRWERGHRAPNPEALSKLAAIAQSNKQTRLAKIFESKLKARIATRIRNLPSKRTQRRISLEDLKFNAAVARDLIKALRAMVERVEKDFPTAGWLTDGLRNAQFYLGRQLEETELHISEHYGWDRAEEDKKLLLRPPKLTYGLEANSAKKRKTRNPMNQQQPRKDNPDEKT